MKHPLLVWPQWALMLLISALFYVGFFHLNGWLFSAFEHSQGVNWIFLPAGFRVLLVLALGLPGALGIVLGNLWIDQDHFDASGWTDVVLTGLASGLGPWVVKCWMESRGLLDSRLQHINVSRLLQFVLLYAIVNAVLHQLIRWYFRPEASQPWLDVWPMFVGDTLGALAVLYAMKLGLNCLRQRMQGPA